ncbi:unnamed protein product [Meloidogyne enterolobii]|uniref:Uncharacterized protein n=1 Tax=Meloidogyne enterolobii TaxID=390850 RepID=A0ACB0YTZ5_MELEN
MKKSKRPLIQIGSKNVFNFKVMNDFIKWLESDGNILFSNVDICLIDKSVGYGLFAKENVRLNEVLIKIPEKYIITADFVSNIKEYSDILNRFVFDFSELLALFFAFERVYLDYFCKQFGSLNDGTAYFVQWTLEMPNGFEQFLDCRKKLMNEKRNESDFWWKSYIGILPRNFSTPLFIYYLKENGQAKIKEIACQLPIETKEKLLGQLDELIVFEEKFFKLLLNSSEEDASQIAKELSQDSIIFWREICCWAWHIVNTSIFTENLSLHSVDKQKSYDKNQKNCSKKKIDEENFGGSLALVPLVDMLNHSPDASCVPFFDKKMGFFKVIAEHHSIVAGQQLFFCYGAHNNDQLWIEYGFRLLENPFNRVNISIDLFVVLAERCGQKVESARREILKKARLPCTIYATDEIPSFALRKNSSILLMKKSKLSNWSQYLFSDEENEYDEEGILTSPEIKLIVSILRKLENALIARRNECLMEEICASWDDQIQILKRMLIKY